MNGFADLSKKTLQLKEAFEAGDLIKLRLLSNDCIEKAALKQSKELVQLSLIAYSLSKILSKEHIICNINWPEARNRILEDIDFALTALEKNDLKAFNNSLNDISGHITGIDKQLGNFVIDLMEKARLKQASRVYAFGLSLKAAVELTGTQEQELLKYIGGTRLADERIEKKGINDRLKDLKKILK